MMKNKEFLTVLLLFFLTGGIILAQENRSELTLSLKEAQEYAIQNNKMVISAKMDVEASKIALWETISNGLPQVSVSGSFTDNLKLMTTLLPGDFFGRPGEKVPVTFGSQFNSGASIQASLLLFNAPFYIGIETTKLAQKLSEESLAKSELDTKESVSTAYFLILVAEKSLQILDGNIANLNETLKSTKAMYSAGMAESTDVDQMVSNVTMVENTRSSMQRAIELNYNLLRFQLGVPAETRITLKETLENLTSEINIEALLSQQFDHQQNMNFMLVEGQEQMSALALKSQKASVLPTLAGFYNYGTNGMGDKIGDQRWFQNSMTGLQLSVPIFASGQRYSKIKKAQLSLEKARTTKEMVTDQLLLQEKQLRYNLVNANLQYKSQKDNIDVAKRVYASMENKFRQGMASSLELTQANSLYLQAENNYVSALMYLLQTKLALDKLLNNM
ncbi:MAG: TolC family protein [Bacteroidia bacterium]|nr:TolC family protein [Bacteroidia bacterium]